MKVLIVDDNPAIRGTVRNLLETDPTFQVCGEAENGLEAIQMTSELRPELVVMDLSMPVLNGLDAARGIRRIKRAIPIILFSSYSDLLTQEEARSVGIAALVPKSEPSMLLTQLMKFSGRVPLEGTGRLPMAWGNSRTTRISPVTPILPLWRNKWDFQKVPPSHLS